MKRCPNTFGDTRGSDGSAIREPGNGGRTAVADGAGVGPAQWIVSMDPVPVAIDEQLSQPGVSRTFDVPRVRLWWSIGCGLSSRLLLAEHASTWHCLRPPRRSASSSAGDRA